MIASNVVKLPEKKEAAKTSEKKWGKAVMKLGFNMFPSLLLRAQRRLGLNPTQLAVIIQLTDFWWDSGRFPYPSKQALSDRLGIKPRQVQRHLADLETAGLIKRIERKSQSHSGKSTNIYDLSGLVNRLKELAPEFQKVEDEARDQRRQVKRRGGVAKKSKS